MGARWVDINKGTKENPRYKSRLVAMGFASSDKNMEDLYAATPPLCAFRMLVSACATRCGKGGFEKELLVMDIKKAFLLGACHIHRTPKRK